jgi:hypothetical protein
MLIGKNPMIQVDIGDQPPIPTDSKQSSGNLLLLVFFSVPKLLGGIFRA